MDCCNRSKSTLPLMITVPERVHVVVFGYNNSVYHILCCAWVKGNKLIAFTLNFSTTPWILFVLQKLYITGGLILTAFVSKKRCRSLLLFARNSGQRKLAEKPPSYKPFLKGQPPSAVLFLGYQSDLVYYGLLAISQRLQNHNRSLTYSNLVEGYTGHS